MKTKWGTGGRTLQVGEQGIREGSLRQMKKTVPWFYKKYLDVYQYKQLQSNHREVLLLIEEVNFFFLNYKCTVSDRYL